MLQLFRQRCPRKGRELVLARVHIYGDAPTLAVCGLHLTPSAAAVWVLRRWRPSAACTRVKCVRLYSVCSFRFRLDVGIAELRSGFCDVCRDITSCRLAGARWRNRQGLSQALAFYNKKAQGCTQYFTTGWDQPTSKSERRWAIKTPAVGTENTGANLGRKCKGAAKTAVEASIDQCRESAAAREEVRHCAPRRTGGARGGRAGKGGGTSWPRDAPVSPPTLALNLLACIRSILQKFQLLQNGGWGKASAAARLHSAAQRWASPAEITGVPHPPRASRTASSSQTPPAPAARRPREGPCRGSGRPQAADLSTANTSKREQGGGLCWARAAVIPCDKCRPLTCYRRDRGAQAAPPRLSGAKSEYISPTPRAAHPCTTTTKPTESPMSRHLPFCRAASSRRALLQPSSVISVMLLQPQASATMGTGGVCEWGVVAVATLARSPHPGHLWAGQHVAAMQQQQVAERALELKHCHVFWCRKSPSPSTWGAAHTPPPSPPSPWLPTTAKLYHCAHISITVPTTATVNCT